jgi:hypothetical protein
MSEQKPQQEKPKTIPYWPYCTKCKVPYDFDANEPFAYCKCGTTEWGYPRPESYVLRPAEIITQAAVDVVNERTRQIHDERFDASHDDGNNDGAMALAAASYAANAATWLQHNRPEHAKRNYEKLSIPSLRWPWLAKWWKPKSPRRDLVRAAALIIAEIEKIDRKENRAQKFNPAPDVSNHCRHGVHRWVHCHKCANDDNGGRA